MKFHFQQAVRALILLAFSAMLIKLHITGDMTKYINPKYEMLSQLAALLFLILFLIQTTRIWSTNDSSHHHCDHHDHSCSHDHGYTSFNPKKLISYVIIVIPLITGFFLPPKVLDSAIASKKGGMAILSNQQQNAQGSTNSLTDPTEDSYLGIEKESDSNVQLEDHPTIDDSDSITNEEYDQLIQKLEQSANIQMDDYVYNAYYEEISKDLNKYIGRTIELKGFVYKEDGFSQDQLVISRFLITHCVADASIIGFLTEFSEASTLEMDTWIEAEGVIEMTTYNGSELPIIKITNWSKTSEPEEPYLYPINVKIF